MPRGRGRGRGGGRKRGRGRGRGRGGNSVGKFLAPRTGRQAGRVANAQAGAEFNPEIRNLRQEAKGSRKRQQNLGAWYAQLAADYQGAQNRGSAALQSIQDTTGRQLSEASQRSKASLSELSAQDEAFAKLTGGPKDTKGLSRIAQAGAAAERSRVAISAPIAQEQANFVARLGGNKAAARLGGIEARRKEGRRRSKIKSDLTGVRREKGFARVSRKEDIRAADRDYTTQLKQLKLARREAGNAEQQAAADAAIAQVEAARSAREGATSSRQAQERIGISRRNAATAARGQRATARGGGKGGLTPTQRRAAKEGRRNAGSRARNLISKFGLPKNSKAKRELIQKVANESEVSPADAERAVSRLVRGRRQGNRGIRGALPTPYAPTKRGRRAARRRRRKR